MILAGNNNNLKFTKLNEDRPVVNGEETVQKVRIGGVNEGSTIIRIKVNMGTPSEKTITLTSATILPEAKKTIYLNGVTNLTLYQEEQLIPLDNVLTYNNIVYSLIPIYIIDEDGDSVVLKGNDLVIGNATQAKKLGIKYTGYNGNTDPLISAYLFADNKPGSEPVTSEDEVHYIGIALNYGIGPEELLMRNLIVDYYNATNPLQEIAIQVEPLRIKELIITKQNENAISKLPTGYNYEKFTAGTIASGPRQKDVTIQDFYTGATPNYTVKDSLGNVITTQTEANGKKTVEVTFGYNNITRQVELNVTTQVSGKYYITCWVNVAGEPIELTQEIETVKNPEVANAHIGDLSELTVGIPATRDITFLNKYGEAIDVNYGDVDEIITDGITVQLLNAAGAPTGRITQVELVATKAGNPTLDLKVNNITLPTITFTAKEEVKVSIDITGVEVVDGEKVIRLYEQDPGKANVVSPDGDLIYTLIPIKINNNGIETKVLGNLTTPDGKKLELTYTGYEDNPDLWDIKMFDIDQNLQERAVECDYIGIALFYEEESAMLGKTITITYPGAEPVLIKVMPSQ